METEAMSSVLASVSSRKEKAAKAMAALHSHRNVITACITEWENLERSFGVTERALQQKFKELAELEVEYDAKMQEAQAAMDKREESIAGREEASLARVKEQKDTAIAAIAEERRKLEEERTKWRAEKGVSALKEEPDGDGKVAGKDVVLSKSPLKHTDHGHTPSKDSKEAKQAQQKKGSAANPSSKNVHDELSRKKADKDAEIKTGLQKKNVEIKEEKKKGDQQEDTSKNKRKDVIADNETAAKRRKEVSEADAYAATAGLKKGKTVTNAPSLEHAIKLGMNIQIKDLVDNLDYEGLKDFFANNKKELQKLRPELQAALQSSRDPCRLSLKILELSEGVDRIFVNNKSGHACILLLECLSEVVADPVLGIDFPVVPSDVKEIARSIARRWKSLLETPPHPQDGFGLGSHLLLQLLATFGIGTDYSADDLLNYVVPMSRRGIGPALCRSLGLTEKIPVVVDRLVKEGKQIDAIAYASEFGLLDKYSPGALLKSYIEDSQKVLDAEKASSVGGNLGELYSKQITALKHAIKVLVDYKLDSQLPVEDLRSRMAALKQERVEIKKMSSTSKLEHKYDKPPEELQSGRPNDANDRSDEAVTGTGVESDYGRHGGYFSPLERGHYAPTDLGRPNRVDYTPTDIGRPLFVSYNLDRLSRRPESTYESYGLGGRRPISLSNSNPYASRDSMGSYPSGPSSVLPGFHSYSGMSRDDSEMLSNFSSSSGRPPYPETRGPISNYQPGSGLPPSSTYLPYYLR